MNCRLVLRTPMAAGNWDAFNRSQIDALIAGDGKPDTRYLLQGRDDNTGAWVPSQLHTPLGATAGKALK